MTPPISSEGSALARRRTSLRARIIAWSFVPTVIILVAVAATNLYSYQRVTEDLVIERDEKLAQLAAGQLFGDLTAYTELLASRARSAQVSESAPEMLQQALREASRWLGTFDAGVVALDTAGRVVAALPERPDRTGQDWSDRSYFRRMLGTPGPLFSNVVADGPSGEEVVVVGVPIVGFHGQFVGMLAGMFRVGPDATSDLYRTFHQVSLSGRGQVYVVDGAGRVVYHSQRDRVGQAADADPDVLSLALSGVSGHLLTDADNGRVIVSYAPVPGTPWALFMEESWDELMSSSSSYRAFLLLLLALGVAVPTLIVSLSVRRITDPIARLAQGARRVADGHFGRVEVDTGDELEVLAEQFNRMSSQLAQSYADLERRVADRTRDLAALNTIAAVASRSLRLEEVLSGALEQTMAYVGMDAGAAYRVDESTSGLHLTHAQGLSPSFIAQVARLTSGEGAAGAAEATGEVVVRRPQDYPEGPLKEAVLAEGLELVVSVPLLARGRMLGTLNLAGRTFRELTADDISLLAGIGNQVAIAADNARLYENAEVSAAAAERSRLARDLHDSVTQTLFSASLIAEVLPRIWKRDAAAGERRLAQLRQLTRGALAEMRTLLLELRPAALEEAPLEDLLRQLGEAVAGRAQVPVSVSVEGSGELPAQVRVALYRIAQEALNNVARHSRAGAAQVRLTFRDEIVDLAIADDGVGFDPRAPGGDHLGLRIMRERADGIGAHLDVTSSPGRGTEVLVRWPREPEVDGG
ncbi:MAG: GAF domain-containing protein [Anaerolineae bacterium]|nr:GAF domain-containing protein [Anaerolineae bacterium]